MTEKDEVREQLLISDSDDEQNTELQVEYSLEISKSSTLEICREIVRNFFNSSKTPALDSSAKGDYKKNKSVTAETKGKVVSNKQNRNRKSSIIQGTYSEEIRVSSSVDCAKDLRKLHREDKAGPSSRVFPASIAASSSSVISAARSSIAAMSSNIASLGTSYEKFQVRIEDNTKVRSSSQVSLDSDYKEIQESLRRESDEIFHRRAVRLAEGNSSTSNRGSRQITSTSGLFKFIGRNFRRIYASRLHSGGYQILNDDDTNVTFAEFKPDVIVNGRTETFQRISHQGLMSGGEVVLEDLADEFRPLIYEDDSSALSEVSQNVQGTNSPFRPLTEAVEAGGSVTGGGIIGDSSQCTASLPELFPRKKRKNKLKFSFHPAKYFSSGRKIKLSPEANTANLSFRKDNAVQLVKDSTSSSSSTSSRCTSTTSLDSCSPEKDIKECNRTSPVACGSSNIQRPLSPTVATPRSLQAVARYGRNVAGYVPRDIFATNLRSPGSASSGDASLNESTCFRGCFITKCICKWK